MAIIVKQTDLHYLSGSSDKTYSAAVLDNGDGTFSTPFAYGRRNSTLNHGYKCERGSMSSANAAYNKIISEKTGKGYRPSPGVNGNVFGHLAAAPAPSPKPSAIPDPAPVVEKEMSGVMVQLLNVIDETDLDSYINDARWGAQEKKDGHRRAVILRDGCFFGSNKKGHKVGVPSEVTDALIPGGFTSLTIDGELIGSKLFVFDLLEANGTDYTGKSYFSRFRSLELLFGKLTGPNLQIVPLAISAFEKASLLERLRREKREGIVFKLLSAKHTPGRPASGGDQMKYPFTASASVVVTGVNGSKRSVSIGVIAGSTLIPVGNVTIPPNFDVPKKDAVVECRYLYYNEGGALYQPVYLGERDDVEISECVKSQLKLAPVDKAA